jgi:hypothetical protein
LPCRFHPPQPVRSATDAEYVAKSQAEKYFVRRKKGQAQLTIQSDLRQPRFTANGVKNSFGVTYAHFPDNLFIT